MSKRKSAEDKNNNTQLNDTSTNSNSQEYELNARNDFVLVHSNSLSTPTFSVNEINNWLRNPIVFHNQLRKVSKYYYNKNGIIKEVYNLYRDLPTLNYTVMYNNRNLKKIETYEKNVNAFLNNIDVKQLVKDTLFSLPMNGTVVWYKRNNSYIQLLDLEYLRFSKQINGEFVPEFDMQWLDRLSPLSNVQYTNTDLYLFIESLPDEITIEAYKNYKKDSTKRFVQLNPDNVCVFKINAERNQALGLPLSIPAIPHILHLELLERSEESLAQRVIQQIILQKVSSPDGKNGGTRPPSKQQIDYYHNNLKGLLQKTGDTTSGGSAPLTVPDWVDIKPLEVNITTFPKEIYERIINEILLAMGCSSSLINGAGQNANFSSASVNVEKVYRNIYSIIDQVEKGLNKFLNQIVSTKNVTPSIKFNRDTFLNKKDQFDMAKALYLEARGSLKALLESAGFDFQAYIDQCEYENKVLDLDNLDKFPIHPTSYTIRGVDDGGTTDANGNPTGRPAKTGTDMTDSTAKSKANNANSNPSPSDN